MVGDIREYVQPPGLSFASQGLCESWHYPSQSHNGVAAWEADPGLSIA